MIYRIFQYLKLNLLLGDLFFFILFNFSDAEDGEISDSGSDGEVFDKPDEPSIFPKKLEKPVVKEPPVRERPLCRYYK